ncbi:single-stranded-DNA-specific exonuclease RecJ [Jannaschia aquimarina]|uniref:Single-stranded-DNA-specific exonuclease RecJ n=1 Tax=Jannaschia aquimarina TaxID=935700 RepID=A0A0D1EJS1_9RHOB|nr:single-stranded-DNA-specific exonuclease RecJ [Jannaschia aquimarina]KIT16050.1 Single-stranded-DNA-specific exonuclease RecJ [Jannaschia aquimarina]SNT01101.1 exonuclease RecJ [Jannaschia aquimarina]
MSFLGVTASATGRRWIGPGPEAERLADALAQAGHPRPLAQHLARRGVTADTASAFLDPKLRDLLPDPRGLRDMQIAAERLLRAARTGERIAIFADYDVDGGASAALLIWWLRALDRDATLYIPDRVTEGYGPNAPAMARLAEGHDLIVCVDCGTAAHDALDAATKADIIVLDHHLGAETLPPALAIVNPNRQDEDRSQGHLCAAAVTFLCLVEANRQGRGATPMPDLMAMLDLVALATVADVAPLVGVNRALVRAGLTVMRQRARPGLRALSDRARLEGPPSAYHLGYLLGPRINAGGRIGAADLGARLLATSDPSEADALAERLDALNAERRAIETRITEAALEQAATREGAIAWAAGDGWHPGVVGIVASRLKDATNRPSLVIGVRPDGTAQGSARSVSGVDIGAAVQRLVTEGLATKGGGHVMAAGITLSADGIEPAMERLAELVERQGGVRSGPRDLTLDGALMAGGAHLDLVRALDAAGPFGQGAPAPRFALPDLRVAHTRTVGDGHLKVTLADGPSRLDAIAFRCPADLSDLLSRADRPVHVAGRLEVNRWQGRESVQLKLEDAAPASG